MTKEQIGKIDLAIGNLIEIKGKTLNESIITRANDAITILGGLRFTDSAPSTEREVWIDEGDGTTSWLEGCIHCHTRKWTDSEFECQTDCAAFAIKDGCAICKMMHGDQIIGRIVERPRK